MFAKSAYQLEMNFQSGIDEISTTMPTLDDVGLVVLLPATFDALPGVPIIASGGMGSAEHLVDVVKRGSADAVAMADILHYERLGLTEIHAIGRTLYVVDLQFSSRPGRRCSGLCVSSFDDARRTARRNG